MVSARAIDSGSNMRRTSSDKVDLRISVVRQNMLPPLESSSAHRLIPERDHSTVDRHRAWPALMPLTLDQIAALKGHEGWGVVFRQMKAGGLLQAKTLGQVVSSYRQEPRASTAA